MPKGYPGTRSPPLPRSPSPARPAEDPIHRCGGPREALAILDLARGLRPDVVARRLGWSVAIVREIMTRPEYQDRVTAARRSVIEAVCGDLLRASRFAVQHLRREARCATEAADRIAACRAILGSAREFHRMAQEGAQPGQGSTRTTAIVVGSSLSPDALRRLLDAGAVPEGLDLSRVPADVIRDVYQDSAHEAPAEVEPAEPAEGP